MEPEQLRLSDPQDTIREVLKMENACIIVEGPQEQVYGTLDFKTMFVWTSREKADIFFQKNLNPEEDKIIEMPMEEIIQLAKKLTFSIVRFNFEHKDCHPQQQFVNYKLSQTGTLELMSTILKQQN